MNVTLEEQYFVWLYSNINDPELTEDTRTYWNLARQLHDREFVYIIANDDNRWLDGRDLRNMFIADMDDDDGTPIYLRLNPACSVLEMLIALCIRLEFQTDEPVEDWFWKLLSNLRIGHYNDHRYDEETRIIVDDVIDTLIWRNYKYDGTGGLFPLRDAQQDQRKLEIWYQMHSYLLEG